MELEVFLVAGSRADLKKYHNSNQYITVGTKEPQPEQETDEEPRRDKHIMQTGLLSSKHPLNFSKGKSFHAPELY